MLLHIPYFPKYRRLLLLTRRAFAFTALACILAVQVVGTSSAGVPVDGAMSRADTLLGITYRPDGVRDERGRWTLFEHPEQSFPSPGLNCSGLTYALWRLLVPGAVPVALAGRDRLGDSAPGAAMGQDWDYGFDLILNLSEGLPRRWLLPDPRPVRDIGPAMDSGRDMIGFPVAAREDWRKALAALQPGHACLVSFTQTGRRKGYTLQHYHVGVILPDASGGRWLYQATPKSGTYKMNLASSDGMARFLAGFSGGDRRVLLLDVTIPAARGAAP